MSNSGRNAKMRAITKTGDGGAEVLQWGEVIRPQPRDGEVLLRVAATAFNRADAGQREGRYPPPEGVSEVLGLECSGTIEEVGRSVADWHIGDRVCALLAGGGYAEFVAVPQEQLLPVPRGVGLLEAAVLPEVACTVWSNLAMPIPPAQGDVILIHGGAGGIGSFAIQLGKALQCVVATTVGSDRGIKHCEDLGADLVIDYRTEDFVTKVLGIGGSPGSTDGLGADLILDIVGADYLRSNIDALAIGGRIAVIGAQSGADAALNLKSLMAKRGSLTATTLRARAVRGKHSKAEIVEGVRKDVWPLIEEGLIQPVVGCVFPLSEAAEAHRLHAAREVPPGKILLVVEGLNEER